MSEASSEPLMRYLKGEIAVFELLEITEDTTPHSDSEKCATDLVLENLLKDDHYGDDDDDDDTGDLEKDDNEERAGKYWVHVSLAYM